MSPRRPHLRNRKRIKAPRRFDDDGPGTSSPRQDSYEEESEESSELEEEIYKSPNPKKPKSKTRAYRGQVIEFNPNLPPAAFPTLDHPNYVHNGGNVAIDLDLYLSGSQSGSPSLAGSEAIHLDLLGRGCHSEETDLTGDRPTMKSTTTGFSRRGSQSLMQTSIIVQKRPRASIPSSMYGEPTDNGPRNPIWASNMARMEEAGKMSDLRRAAIMDMESSDEEDRAVRQTKLAKTASIPQFPAWADLTVTHKLDLADAIGRFYPNAWQVMHLLRLSVPEKRELAGLLDERRDRNSREEANQQRLQEQTKDALLTSKHLTQSAFHEMVEVNLYGTIDEEDHNQTCPRELEKAKAYMRYCGFNPALAASNWDVPTISNAASGTEPRTVQRKPKASLPGTAAGQTPPNHSNGHFSQRPALVTSSQQASCPPDPRLKLVPQSTQGAPPQHRPTPAHALIAQHSPAAPLSKVPVQSYRVASGNQSGNLHAGYQGAARIPQNKFRALPEKPNASTGPDLRAINIALSTARGTSAVLPPMKGPHSPPLDSHSQALKPLPTGPRRNQIHQSNGNSNIGASAADGSGGIVENGDSVNKKKRKKGAT